MSMFAPVAPTIAAPPTEVAPDTYVIHQVQPALGAPLFVYINSMVILGEQPMIVDTGTPANRAQWLDDVFGLVSPDDVRWVYLSHDDVDHSGNLDEVMTACPNATLVCNWAMVERHTNCFNFPLERCRWVADGDTIDLGDRTLRAIRPPVFDSPTTRGLFDESTGLYWAVDSFATPLPDPEATLDDLDEEFWFGGMTMFAYGAVSPWLSFVDADKYAQYVDRLQGIGITAVAACHTPVLRGDRIDAAFAHFRGLPTTEVPPLPDQAVLEAIVAAMADPALPG